MGTSTSNSGAMSGISFDPPWLNLAIPNIDLGTNEYDLGNNSTEQNDSENENNSILLNDPSSDLLIPHEAVSERSSITLPNIDPLIGIAPRGRFAQARKNLNAYINSNDKKFLKKTLGSYSAKGMGGARNVSKRLQGSASVGQILYSFLKDSKISTTLKEWVQKLSSTEYSKEDLVNEIINKIVPVGGSLDEESYKDSIHYAMIELLELNPDCDLLNLDIDSIWTVLELFISKEAFNRIDFEIGQRFESNKSTPLKNVSHMNEMQEYLKFEISAQMQDLRSDKLNIQSSQIGDILQTAIANTFFVFEEEL